MVWISLATLPYYTTIFTWVLSYWFSSLHSPLPWEKETADESIWNVEYFPNEVLERSDSISDPMRLVTSLAVLLFLTYVIIYFTMWKGLMSSSQVVYVTVSTPYFLMIVLLIKGLTLPGSEIGLKYLLIP
mmetsp:Transcript_24552/g.38086  ORF Transcript_24552/g.38086 Transcript_24552/m.38086 type:complete len:130 (+) Transcript_24552:431-820(+)